AAVADGPFVSGVDIAAVAPLVDWFNLMTYDFCNSMTPDTCHHTGLHPSALAPADARSTDRAVRQFLSAGAPARKLLIGVAMYGREFDQVDPAHDGLYQPYGHYEGEHSWPELKRDFIDRNGYVRHWDRQAQAPWLWNPHTHAFITYDDPQSIAAKSAYVKALHVGGIMYWEVQQDPSGELLGALWRSMHSRTPGTALRRASGMGAPHSAQTLSPGPLPRLLRARAIASATVASICSCTAPSLAQPVAMTVMLANRALGTRGRQQIDLAGLRHHAVAALRLGHVPSVIGGRNEDIGGLRFLRLPRADSDAYLEDRRQRRVRMRHGLVPHTRTQVFGHARGIGEFAARQQQRQLFAAVARDQILAYPHAVAAQPRQLAQAFVPIQMSAGIVQCLEPIHVHQQQRQRAPRVRVPPPFLGQPQVETAAIGDARQAIAHRQFAQFAIGLLQFAHHAREMDRTGDLVGDRIAHRAHFAGE